ncbi:MAG: hypoxanthine phosphoribosyltransferase [Bacteroidetes bacterium]|nr:hypoxanthine phosphoribosyltransferase [Bacteroidota bacterium]MCL1968651.1 hypoxanthine phosphoribosyltransferase [Bacteroidota bacterium]
MNNIIQLHDKKFVKYISAQEIDEAITAVANQLNKDYTEEPPLILVTLNGAIVFAADLLKQLQFSSVLSCIKLSSYQGTQSTENMKTLIGLNEDVKGKRVLIIEDIVDTGKTYQTLVDLLNEKGAKEIRIATLTMKPDAYKLDLPVHYIGINIPDKFVVGRGLDYDGLGRNFNDIYQLYTD